MQLDWHQLPYVRNRLQLGDYQLFRSYIQPNGVCLARALRRHKPTIHREMKRILSADVAFSTICARSFERSSQLRTETPV